MGSEPAVIRGRYKIGVSYFSAPRVRSHRRLQLYLPARPSSVPRRPRRTISVTRRQRRRHSAPLNWRLSRTPVGTRPWISVRASQPASHRVDMPGKIEAAARSHNQPAGWTRWTVGPAELSNISSDTGMDAAGGIIPVCAVRCCAPFAIRLQLAVLCNYHVGSADRQLGIAPTDASQLTAVRETKPLPVQSTYHVARAPSCLCLTRYCA